MLDKLTLLALTQQYYKLWENKDIDNIKNMFSKDIVLIDPVVKRIEGLSSVLKVNENIFNSCITIRIIEMNVFVDQFSDTTIGEVKFFDDRRLIEVVDIFSFDGKSKINKIVAYLDTKYIR